MIKEKEKILDLKYQSNIKASPDIFETTCAFCDRTTHKPFYLTDPATNYSLFFCSRHCSQNYLKEIDSINQQIRFHEKELLRLVALKKTLNHVIK